MVYTCHKYAIYIYIYIHIYNCSISNTFMILLEGLIKYESVNSKLYADLLIHIYV